MPRTVAGDNYRPVKALTYKLIMLGGRRRRRPSGGEPTDLPMIASAIATLFVAALIGVVALVFALASAVERRR